MFDRSRKQKQKGPMGGKMGFRKDGPGINLGGKGNCPIYRMGRNKGETS